MVFIYGNFYRFGSYPFRRLRRVRQAVPSAAGSGELFIDRLYLCRSVAPLDARDLLVSLAGEHARQGGVGDKGVDSVGHGIHVPIIHLQRVVEHFRDARLFGDDDRYVGFHRLQRGYAERFRDRRHDIDVAHGEHAVHLGTLQESGEVETVGDTERRHTPDYVVHQVAASGHDETDVRDPSEHLRRRFDEVIRPLLVGDASQKGHDFVVQAAYRLALVVLRKTDGIVDGNHLFGRNAVLRYDDVACQVAYGYHPVGSLHARPFDVVDGAVDVFAAAVELRGVHVYHERFARHGFGRHAGIVGEPVVGVDDIEFARQVAGYLRGHRGVAGHLFHQVGAVPP